MLIFFIFINTAGISFAQFTTNDSTNKKSQGHAVATSIAVMSVQPFESEQLFGSVESWSISPLNVSSKIHLIVSIKDVTDPNHPTDMHNPLVISVTNRCLVQCGLYDYPIPNSSQTRIIFGIHLNQDEKGYTVYSPIDVSSSPGEIASVSLSSDGIAKKALFPNQPLVLSKVAYSDAGQRHLYEFIMTADGQ
jgi:hypothetical protein